MKLSIIIPVYNVEDYLLRCLNSCVNQDVSLGEYEIIIVNDGSTDRSFEIAEEFAKQHSYITLISQNNKGLSAARNAGLKEAKGKYVWFVDSDDWIAKDCLAGLFEKFEEYDADVVGICKANVIDGQIHEHFFYSDILDKTIVNGADALKYGYVKNICAPYSIYKRVYLINNSLCFLEGVFHEDNEFTPRAYYLANKTCFYNKICYYTYQRPNSITASVNPKRSFDMITVAQSLHVFCERVSSECRFVFHRYISNLINESLLLSVTYSKENKARLSNLLYLMRHLFAHMRKSNNIKYKIEGILFSFFPKRVLYVYNCLSFIEHNTLKNDKSK